MYLFGLLFIIVNCPSKILWKNNNFNLQINLFLFLKQTKQISLYSTLIKRLKRNAITSLHLMNFSFWSSEIQLEYALCLKIILDNRTWCTII